MADQNWDRTKPIDHLLIGDVPAEIRGLRSSTKTIIQKEHIGLGADNAGGQHLKGSARVYLQSGIPSTDPESNNLETGASTGDDGRMSVDTSVATGSLVRVYIATSAGISTGWLPTRVAYAGTSYAHVARTSVNVNNLAVINIKNDEFITAYINADTSATINIAKINADDLIEFGDVAAMVMTSVMTGITASKHISNKAYVDREIAAGADPAYVGGESHTFNGGLIVKFGSIARGGADTTVTFDVAFPTAIITALAQSGGTDGSENACVKTLAVGSIVIVSGASEDPLKWVAFGY